MGLDQNTLERLGAVIPNTQKRPTDGYGLTYFWDRQNYTLGGYALHVYPTEYLRAEVLGHIGAGGSPYAGTANQVDVRPSVIFDIGWVKLKAGLEYGLSRPQVPELKLRDRRNGYGFAAQFVVAPYVEFGASFARGYESYVVQTRSGQVHAGTLAGETADAVLLRTPAEVRLPRASVKNIRQDRVSIMPQGLEAQLSREELADLLAFLQSLK